ncbi:putative protein, chloroplastic [Sesamum alatum]|uniref:Uncharacterized protein n=1 Tax=Sesamum alatum TaxID=300844 RepID=A0AAE2CML8_9LAMI|nr:putative protein, chloroplastic [Sesamum alatum]
MADVGNRRSGSRRQSTRLQRRAPASIQISPVTEWNVAIPLLSPLVQSPTSDHPLAEVKSCGNSNKESAAVAERAVAVTKKWQTAPFYYEPPPFAPFVCAGSLDR